MIQKIDIEQIKGTILKSLFQRYILVRTNFLQTFSFLYIPLIFSKLFNPYPNGTKRIAKYLLHYLHTQILFPSPSFHGQKEVTSSLARSPRLHYNNANKGGGKNLG